MRLDTNTYSVPHTLVGKSVHIRANDTHVRVIENANVVAEHDRCWDRRKAIEDRAHIEALLEKRPGALGPKRRDRLASLSPEARTYLHQIARRRLNLENEVRKLLRLIDVYGEADVALGMAAALGAHTFGARYVRALIDQARFARGLGEPAEPIVTGNAIADSTEVEPHNLESYDVLF